ncbi:MAG: hypothetical protein ABSB26_01215 [Nitrososphaerales archaeon]
MPELWIPYGSVETLVTVQAENLGAVVDPQAENSVIERERMLETMSRASAVFICDASPTTAELLRELTPGLDSASPLKMFSAAPRRIEYAVPELKGRITTLPPPVSPNDGGTVLARELTERGTKLFLGTPRPDPMFGITDAKVEACLNWIAHSHREAAEARKEMEPSPFEMTRSRETMNKIAEEIAEASFIDVISRGGKARAVLEDAPFDAIKNGFLSVGVQPARAIVVGTGGKGYDDTLSSAIRTTWNALSGVRKAGSVVLLAECSEGLGSTALDMAATERLSGEGGRRRETYIDGLEDVFYLSKLRDEYDVLLLSGLPEVYAKSKLGLATARGSAEAIGRLLNKLGRSGKMNVVTRAAECRFESA